MLNKKALAAFAAGATLLSGFAFAAPANAMQLDLVSVLENENFVPPADNDELGQVLFGGAAGSYAGGYDEYANDEDSLISKGVDPLDGGVTTVSDDDFNFDDLNLDDLNLDDVDLSDVDVPAAPAADDATPAAPVADDDFNFDDLNLDDLNLDDLNLDDVDLSDVDAPAAPAADDATPAADDAAPVADDDFNFDDADLSDVDDAAPAAPAPAAHYGQMLKVSRVATYIAG